MELFLVVLIFIIWLIVKIAEWLGFSSPSTPPYHPPNTSSNIRDHDINSIRSSGKFSASERQAEYRRRGKSPSGVIDGVYNDANRGNDEYNDTYRDHDADA